MEILNRKAIKRQAREFIGIDRRWLYMALACLPLTLIQGAMNGGITVVRQFTENGRYADTSYSVSSGSGIIAWLLIPFTIAMTGYFLNHLRGNNPDWKSLYREGIDNFGSYFTAGVVTQLFITLWSLLFIIPGVIKGFQWFFVHQIMHDNPKLDGKQARDLSKRMTDGFKSEIFTMCLSFILWYIFVVMTFGIALLYVSPYVSCTTAMYYENLKHNALMRGIASPDEFGIVPVIHNENAEYSAEAPADCSYSSPEAQTVESDAIDIAGVDTDDEAVEEVIDSTIYDAEIVDNSTVDTAVEFDDNILE